MAVTHGQGRISGIAMSPYGTIHGLPVRAPPTFSIVFSVIVRYGGQRRTALYSITGKADGRHTARAESLLFLSLLTGRFMVPL